MMDIEIRTMAGKSSGTVTVSRLIFGLTPRQDLLSRMVRYQLALRRQGSHCVKNRSDVKATGRKMYKQKGTNNARHSTVKAPQFRGGGRVFGPTPRDHSIGLPKKVRALALRHALSAKASTNSLMVIDDFRASKPKTSSLRSMFAKLGLTNALIIGGHELDRNFQLAMRNIPCVDVLPVQGINVYDILHRKTLVLSKSAIEALEERLK